MPRGPMARMKPKARIPLAVRFWAKVEPEPNSGCLLWLAATVTSTGARHYGVIGMGGRRDGTRLAHHVAFELAGGVIPDGVDVMHKCDNPRCVNIDHLSIGTRSDNMRDCVAKGRYVSALARVTHCPQGHPYNEENTCHSGGRRSCRACGRNRANAKYWLDPEAINRPARERRHAEGKRSRQRRGRAVA